MKPRMEEATLVILLLSGLSTHSAYSREYYYVNLEMNWIEAQTYCREKFTDLATINNDNDNQRLLTLAHNNNKYIGAIWIGLYDDINSWKWSMEDKEYYVDRAAEFTTWFKGQPNNLNANQYCVTYDDKKELNDRPCGHSFPFICYDANSTTSYVLVAEKHTWLEAQTYCREHHRDLASIRNKEESDNIQLALNASHKNVWIGLYRKPWAFWSDNSNSTFTNWAAGQPDNRFSKEFCGDFSADSGKWRDEQCHQRKSFFCFKEAKKLTIWKIKIRSAADMNSKEIQQQVLQQLQAHMVSKQLGNFQIKWRNVQSCRENHKKKPDGEVKCKDAL